MFASYCIWMIPVDNSVDGQKPKFGAGPKFFDDVLLSPRRYPYFDVGWGLCGQMILRAVLAVAYATGRASHARQVKGDDPDKKGNPGPPGWGLA
jgi:hypothetical protein